MLTGISAHWLEQTRSIIDNHFVTASKGIPQQWRGRAMLEDGPVGVRRPRLSGRIGLE
jgi:hypothetical protein